jgi:WD40 repeat protein
MKNGKSLAFVLLLTAALFSTCGKIVTHATPPMTATHAENFLGSPRPNYKSPTPYLTHTPDLLATYTAQSSYATRQADNTATSMVRSTQLAAFPAFPSGCNKNLFTISSNGEWIVADECYIPDPTLVVMNKSGTLHWDIHYNDYSYLPDYGYIYIQSWSNDNRYLYFSTAHFGDGGLCFIGYDSGGFGLFRLDVQTGVITALLPLRSEFAQYTWSFSPSGRRFVYEQVNNAIHLWDLYTGEVTSIQLPNDINHIGGFLWSEDGLRFAYTAVGSMESKQGYYELYLTDIAANSTRVLMKSPITKCVRAFSWASKNVLNIEILDESTWTFLQASIDINTSQFVATPAPRP